MPVCLAQDNLFARQRVVSLREIGAVMRAAALFPAEHGMQEHLRRPQAVENLHVPAQRAAGLF